MLAVICSKGVELSLPLFSLLFFAAPYSDVLEEPVSVHSEACNSAGRGVSVHVIGALTALPTESFLHVTDTRV